MAVNSVAHERIHDTWTKAHTNRIHHITAMPQHIWGKVQPVDKHQRRINHDGFYMRYEWVHENAEQHFRQTRGRKGSCRRCGIKDRTIANDDRRNSTYSDCAQRSPLSVRLPPVTTLLIP
jgi:hypothetical protein